MSAPFVPSKARFRVSPGDWLRGAKPTIVGVDFETFYTSTYSVSEMGNWAYCHDARFDAYLVAVTDGTRTCVCEPKDFPWASIEGIGWVSHHRDFDQAVYRRVKSEIGIVKGGTGPRVWHCSGALCAYLQLPRDLEGAAFAVLGVVLKKAVRSSNKGKNRRALPCLVDPDLLDYAAKDAEACLAIWLQLEMEWPAHERRLFELTSAMGEGGLCMDWEYVESNRKELVESISAIAKGLPFKPALSIKKFEQACEVIGVAPPASTAAKDSDFLRWVDDNIRSEAVTWVRHMQRIRSANRTAKVLESMQVRRMRATSGQSSGISDQSDGPSSPLAMPGRSPEGDRMAFELKYFGASTGRWSGGGGLNLQNLNRKEAEGVDLRRAIVAPPGKVLGIADYSQIESRVLLFLAGDVASLDMFRANPDADAYEIHARATMGWRPVGSDESLKDFCDRTGSGLRQLAKARVLGLGFKCGARTFVEVAKSMAGLDLTEEEAEKAVNEFRQSNPKIVELWDRLERACGESHGSNYVLPLPCTQSNGALNRYLIYRDVLRRRDGLVCTVNGERIIVYGGLLAENWTQATARDVMGSAWLRCTAEGFTPVLTVHDELVFELDEATAERDLQRIKEIMERPIPWAMDLPLRVDAKIRKEYGK